MRDTATHHSPHLTREPEPCVGQRRDVLRQTATWSAGAVVAGVPLDDPRWNRHANLAATQQHSRLQGTFRPGTRHPARAMTAAID